MHGNLSHYGHFLPEIEHRFNFTRWFASWHGFLFDKFITFTLFIQFRAFDLLTWFEDFRMSWVTKRKWNLLEALHCCSHLGKAWKLNRVLIRSSDSCIDVWKRFSSSSYFISSCYAVIQLLVGHNSSRNFIGKTSEEIIERSRTQLNAEMTEFVLTFVKRDPSIRTVHRSCHLCLT